MHLSRGRILFAWALYVTGTSAFLLIPEELPSVLSIFYSNVPPVRKGTDSRVGIGFRLGPNADFQVQFELGPQTNTQPIGPDAPVPAAATKKRQTGVNVKKYNVLNPSEKWLNTWKLNLADSNAENHIVPDKPINVVDPTKRNSDFVSHLRKLYENVNKTVET